MWNHLYWSIAFGPADQQSIQTEVPWSTEKYHVFPGVEFKFLVVFM